MIVNLNNIFIIAGEYLDNYYNNYRKDHFWSTISIYSKENKFSFNDKISSFSEDKKYGKGISNFVRENLK